MYLLIISSADLFPNVSLQGTQAPEQTQPSNLFIYNWPAEEQERHPGSIIALEYCYHKTDPTQVQVGAIFTLILLKPVVEGYRVTYNVEVTPAQRSESCSYRGGVYTCCETRLLRKLVEQTSSLTVPSESTAFGIYRTTTGRDAILGFRAGQEKVTNGFQIPVQDLDRQVGGLIPLQLVQIDQPIQYRMFNFVIGN